MNLIEACTGWLRAFGLDEAELEREAKSLERYLKTNLAVSSMAHNAYMREYMAKRRMEEKVGLKPVRPRVPAVSQTPKGTRV